MEIRVRCARCGGLLHAEIQEGELWVDVCAECEANTESEAFKAACIGSLENAEV